MLTWLRTFRRRFLTRRLRGRRRTSLPRQTAPLFEPLETRALLSATPVGPTADDHPAVDHLPVDLQDLVQELTSHCPQDSDHLPQGPPEGDVPPLDRLGVKIREVIAEHVPFEQTPPTMDDLEDIFEQIKQRIVDKLDPAGEEPTEEGDEAVEQQTKLDVDGLVGSKTISASDHVPDGGDELPPVGEGPAVDVHSIVAERVADGSPALDRVPGGGEDSSAAVSAALADVEDAETSSGGSDGASDGESAGASDGESAGESDGDTSGDSDVSEGGSDVSEGGTDVSDGGSDGSDGGEDGEIAAGIAAAVTDAEESHSDGGGDHGEGHRPIDVQALVTENTDGRG
ncbi:MAG: MSCRAMM family adhesin SdrC, partial [Phycisphaerae bacterium]|nr:MSCRAMM family adhesin SdrC [Phycisphaerae bacterium]